MGTGQEPLLGRARDEKTGAFKEFSSDINISPSTFTEFLAQNVAPISIVSSSDFHLIGTPITGFNGDEGRV